LCQLQACEGVAHVLMVLVSTEECARGFAADDCGVVRALHVLAYRLLSGSLSSTPALDRGALGVQAAAAGALSRLAAYACIRQLPAMQVRGSGGQVHVWRNGPPGGR
jgi:hypothetical protein